MSCNEADQYEHISLVARGDMNVVDYFFCGEF